MELDSISSARITHGTSTSGVRDVQPYYGERWQRDCDRVIKAMARVAGRHHCSAITNITSAEISGIGIEDFAIEAAGRNTDLIVSADDRREVAHADKPPARARSNAHEDDHVVVSVVGVDKVKSRGIDIGLP